MLLPMAGYLPNFNKKNIVYGVLRNNQRNIW